MIKKSMLLKILLAIIISLFGIAFFRFFISVDSPQPPGKEIWRITSYDMRNPEIFGNIVVFGYGNKVNCFCLYAIDMETKKLAWSTEELARPYIEEDLKRDPNSRMYPGRVHAVAYSYAMNLVYVVINSDTLYALDVQSGQVVWQEEVAGFDAVTVSEDTLFLASIPPL